MIIDWAGEGAPRAEIVRDSRGYTMPTQISSIDTDTGVVKYLACQEDGHVKITETGDLIHLVTHGIPPFRITWIDPIEGAGYMCLKKKGERKQQPGEGEG